VCVCVCVSDLVGASGTPLELRFIVRFSKYSNWLFHTVPDVSKIKKCIQYHNLWGITTNKLYFLIFPVFAHTFCIGSHIKKLKALVAPTNFWLNSHTHTHIWRVFHLWLHFITFGGRLTHLTHHVHKSGCKTSIIIIIAHTHAERGWEALLYHFNQMWVMLCFIVLPYTIYVKLLNHIHSTLPHYLSSFWS